MKDEWFTLTTSNFKELVLGVRDTVDVEKASENGTMVMNTPGVNANAVKELVFVLFALIFRPIIENSRNGTNITGPLIF